MAFYGYEVTRSNIFDASVRDCSGKWWSKSKAISAANLFVKENKIGDVITVFEEDTEYDSIIVLSIFNDPIRGITKEEISRW